MTDLGQTTGGEIKVNVMHRVGKYCKLWPEVEDHCFYYDVIKIINAPVVAGSRRQFTF